MNDLVYREKPCNIQKSKAQITVKFEEIDIEICKRACHSMTAWLPLRIDHDGGHFGHYK